MRGAFTTYADPQSILLTVVAGSLTVRARVLLPDEATAIAAAILLNGMSALALSMVFVGHCREDLSAPFVERLLANAVDAVRVALT